MNLRTMLCLLLTFGFVAGCSDQTAEDTVEVETAQSIEIEQKVEVETAQSIEIEEKVEVVVENKTEMVVETPPADVGEAYLFINAKKPGVKVMESGLQFEILKSGDGATPGPTSMVVAHYHGSLTNGDVFDSSVNRGKPAEFRVDRLIKGWTEALQMMKEGDKWRLVIPPELGYGKRGAAGGKIPPDAVLVFDIELIEVK